MENMSVIRYVLSLVVFLGFSLSVSAVETADGMLKRCASGITGTTGITASFTIDYGNQKLSGTMKAAGKKFTLQTPSTSTWYDGKIIFLLIGINAFSTLMTPTPQEVAEANPLSIVNSYSNSFTAAFAKSQLKGCKTIVLTPKSKHSGYKTVHVTIPDGSVFPSKLVIIPASGQKMIVSLNQVKSGQKLSDATFVYPKTKYPKVEIVDLR